MWFSIEHEVPGRVRVRLSGRIAARDVDPLATVVMSAPGARDVRIYPRTGSVAVSYEPVGDARSDVLAYLRGIDEYRWGMLPEEKHAYVEGLRAEGHHVLMVGDGVNDSPALACADVAVFRAGAIGIAELTARGVPSILVPYPFAAANHQEMNARAIVSGGAARMILDKELTAERLLSVLAELLSEDAKLKRMAQAAKRLGRPKAADKIASRVIRLAKGNTALVAFNDQK